MSLSELLFACSLHPDERLLESVVSAYSAGNAYAVVNVDVADLDEQDEPVQILDGPHSLEAALAETGRLLATGGEPVLGLLPVRPSWGEEFGKRLDELFQPCTNVAVASAKISEFDYACRSRGTQRAAGRRACVLQRYAASLALPALPRAVLADMAVAARFTCCEAFVASMPANPGLFFGTSSSSTSVLFAQPGTR